MSCWVMTKMAAGVFHNASGSLLTVVTSMLPNCSRLSDFSCSSPACELELAEACGFGAWLKPGVGAMRTRVAMIWPSRSFETKKERMGGRQHLMSGRAEGQVRLTRETKYIS